MAPMASDGAKFTNRPPMMAHERSLSRIGKKSEAGGAGLMERSDPLKQPGEGGEDPHEVMREHGPAMETHTMHPEGEGAHTVHSKHPDGHEHMSEHGDGKSAHEHAMCLSGHCEHGTEAESQDEPEFE